MDLNSEASGAQGPSHAVNSSGDSRQTAVGLRYYDVIAGIFVAVLLISQTTAQKIVPIGPFNFSAGILLFPISYIFGDVLTEVYGYARSRRVIWIGFSSSALMSICYWISVKLPYSPDWPNQQAFEAVFGFVPRFVVGSLIAFWAGEFANSYVLAKMKILTSGKHLWSRTIGSTIVGQFVDTTLVVIIGFAGMLPWGLMVSIILSNYVAKTAYEIAATPLTYLVVGHLKKVEGVDVFDRATKFSPFKFAD